MSSERLRILAENRRREGRQDLYAPWNPAAQFLVQGRLRRAATLLRAAGVFPDAGTRCLEIGFGRCGWLADLIGWGASQRNLCGTEVDPRRVLEARRRLPAARLVCGDAAELPWRDRSFDLAVLSTVVTSVLDSGSRRRLAAETERVLAPGGALLWFDFAVDSPGNPNVRRVNLRELRELFPSLEGEVRSITLAPPLARLVAPRSWWLAELLECLPFLRTHLLGVLVKPARG